MVEIFFLGSVFCAFLTVYLLLFKENALRSYSDYLLSATFLLQIWCVAIYLLVYSGWITHMPHMYKTAAPINYIIPPLSYLYVRAVLFNEKKLSIIDLSHFVLFILFFLNYIPFFLLPTYEKQLIVDATTKDMSLAYQYKAGLVPEYIGYILRPIQFAFYLFLQWRLVIKFKKHYASHSVEKQVKDVLKWLKVFTWSSTFFLIGFIALILFVVISKDFFSQGIISLIPGIIIALSFFVISIYLLIHPEVLTGLPFIQYKEIESAIVVNQADKIPFIRADYNTEINKIDIYFKEKQPYLINNLSISQVAVILNIPVRDLSYIINNHYELRFNDFLNKYRINHIVENIKENSLDNYTIESIAKQAGFSSKTSFYRAFQKIHQCTPVEFFQKQSSVKA